MGGICVDPHFAKTQYVCYLTQAVQGHFSDACYTMFGVWITKPSQCSQRPEELPKDSISLGKIVISLFKKKHKCLIWTLQAEQLYSWALIGWWWHTSWSPFDLCEIWEHERPEILITWTLVEPINSSLTCSWYINNLQNGSIFNLTGTLAFGPVRNLFKCR